MSTVRRSPAQPPDVDALDVGSPWVLAPADPWAGDERLDLPAADPAVDLPPGELAAWDAAFRAQYAAVLDGRAPWGATAAAARALGVDPPRRHDRRPPKASPLVLEDGALADMVEDRLPDVTPALERVLGPLARERPPRTVRCAAAVVLGRPPMLRHGVRVYERTLKDRPKPEPPVRAAIRAVQHAPAVVFSVTGSSAAGPLAAGPLAAGPLAAGPSASGPSASGPSASGPSASGPSAAGPALHRRALTPITPIGRRHAPSGLVNLAAPLPDAPALVALPIPLTDGRWWLAGVVPLPAVPDAAVLTRRLDLELQRLRRHDRRLTWEDLLRDRGEVLYRTACEWTWMHAGLDAVSRCWSR